MKRLLLPLLAAFALPIAVNAEISDKVHNRCKDAKDYLGCIKAQSGDFNIQGIITNPGTATAKGNACPVGYAYIGKGYCREVMCIWNRPHDVSLAGKMWRCKKGLAFADGIGLQFGGNIRIGNDPSCPKGEPQIGWNSTCNSPYEEPPKKERVVGKKYSGAY